MFRQRARTKSVLKNAVVQSNLMSYAELAEMNVDV